MKSIVLISILFCGFCYADSSWKNEVTIYSGVSLLDAETQLNPCPFCKELAAPFDFNITQSLGTSLLVGFKLGHHFNDNVEVEGNFSIAPSRDLRTESVFSCPIREICPLLADFFPPFFSDETNAVTYYYDGNFVYNFRSDRVTPFLSAGLGGVSTGTEPETHHDLALIFGGGAKFYFGKIGLRIEVNDRIIPEYFLTGDIENDLQVQYGVLFGF